MQYKAPNNTLHEIDPAFAYMLPAGCVPITDEEADAIRAAGAPAPIIREVTMRQARLALLQKGLLGTVNQAIASMPGVAGDAARIEWEFSGTVQRDRPLMTALASTLGLSASELDNLFKLAATL